MRWAAVRMYDIRLGYDYFEHEPTVRWWLEHWSMPPLLLSRGSYHPQLMYALDAVLLKVGLDIDAVRVLSASIGCARLLLIWWALERYLPTRRAVRRVVLALAAAMPVSLHMDVMLNQEPLNNLWIILFIIGIMELGSARPERRWRWGVWLGCVAGLGMLTKASNLILPATLGFGALLEVVQRRDLRIAQRFQRSYAWLGAMCLGLVLASPQYIYNRQVHGKAVIDGWYKRPTADVTRNGAIARSIVPPMRTGSAYPARPPRPMVPSGRSRLLGFEPLARTATNRTRKRLESLANLACWSAPTECRLCRP